MNLSNARLAGRWPRVLLVGMLWTAPPALAQAPSDSADQLTLALAVRQSLAYHPTIAAARAGAVEAGAAVGEATASRLPQVSTRAALTRFQEPMVVAPFHAFDPAAPPQFERTLITGALTADYTLFDGGARGAAVGGARARERVAEAELEGASMGVIAEVTRAFLGVLSSAGVLAAQEQGLEALRAEQARVRLFFTEGRAARVELLRVDAAIAQAEADRTATASTLDASERNLARLLGAAPDETRAGRLRAVRLVDPDTLPTREELLARLESQSPALAAAANARDAAAWGARGARSRWFPRLQLVGGYLGFGSTAGAFTAEWQGGVQVNYPLFLGGARRRAVQVAAARAAQAEERYRLARLAGEQAVDRALSAVEEHRARVRAMATAVDHLDEVVRIEQLALEAGAGTQTEFLRAQAELRRARASLVQARHTEIAAHVALAHAAGELTAEWIEHMLETIP